MIIQWNHPIGVIERMSQDLLRGITRNLSVLKMNALLLKVITVLMVADSLQELWECNQPISLKDKNLDQKEK